MAIDKFNAEKHRLELYTEISPLKSTNKTPVKGFDVSEINKDLQSFAGKKGKKQGAVIVDTKSGQLEYLESMSSIMGTIAGTTQAAGDAFSSYFSAGIEGIQALLPLVQSLMAAKKEKLL